MADNRSTALRSKTMAAVRQKDTGPEMLVRRLLHRLGYRYRLHAKELPGRPDIVFRPRRKAIFVNGCFWHGHGCVKGQLPKSKLEYWGPKIQKNIERDRGNVRELQDRGWNVLVVWQCELATESDLQDRLERFVRGDSTVRTAH